MQLKLYNDDTSPNTWLSCMKTLCKCPVYLDCGHGPRHPTLIGKIRQLHVFHWIFQCQTFLNLSVWIFSELGLTGWPDLACLLPSPSSLLLNDLREISPTATNNPSKYTYIPSKQTDGERNKQAFLCPFKGHWTETDIQSVRERCAWPLRQEGSAVTQSILPCKLH